MQETLGWIYLLPSRAKSVIVQYSPKWKISCVIPTKTRKVNFAFHQCDDIKCQDVEKSFEVYTPSLIMAHSLVPPWIEGSKQNTYFSLHALNTNKKDHLYASPYRLSNVYPSGNICFGETRPSDISNLRKANNLFWSSPFNLDNCPMIAQHRRDCDGLEHSYYDHEDYEECQCYMVYDEELDKYIEDYGVCCECESCSCPCCINVCSCQCACDMEAHLEDWVRNYQSDNFEYKQMTKYYCGEKYWGCPDEIKAIFISNQPDKLGIDKYRKDYKKTKCAIGIADKTNNENWEVNLGQSSITISNDKVKII